MCVRVYVCVSVCVKHMYNIYIYNICACVRAYCEKHTIVYMNMFYIEIVLIYYTIVI